MPLSRACFAIRADVVVITGNENHFRIRAFERRQLRVEVLIAFLVRLRRHDLAAQPGERLR